MNGKPSSSPDLVKEKAQSVKYEDALFCGCIMLVTHRRAKSSFIHFFVSFPTHALLPAVLLEERGRPQRAIQTVEALASTAGSYDP